MPLPVHLIGKRSKKTKGKVHEIIELFEGSESRGT